MSETRETVVSKRRIVNNATTDTLKTSFEDSVGGGQEHTNALWQQLMTFQKLKQLRSRHQKQRKPSNEGHIDSSTHADATAVDENESSDELCFDDSWIIVNQEEMYSNLSETGFFNMMIENSWVFIEKQVEDNNADLNSSGDTVDENIHFVPYMEHEEEDGFQDDDYSDILRHQYYSMDPLERVLEHSEIDWETPIRPLRNHLDEEQVSEASHCSEQEMFIDDDYVLAAETGSFGDIMFCNGDMLLDRLCLSKEYISDRDFWNPPLEGVLENEDYVLPIYDEDVIAAITGIQRRKQHILELVSKGQLTND